MTFLLFNVLFLQLQMLLNLIKNPGVLPLQAHVILKVQDLQASWNIGVEEEGKNIVLTPKYGERTLQNTEG